MQLLPSGTPAAGLIGLLLTLLLAQPARAQSRADTLLTVPMIVAMGGIETPGGDYADRFGTTYSAGAGFWLKTRSRWIFGLEYTYKFTNTVREGVLDSIRLRSTSTPNQLIGADGLFADVRITGRGYTFPVLKVGRVWPAKLLPGAGANAGFYAALGAGFWQHKINFEDVSKTAVQLADDYVKGYDRLTNGVVVTQDVGYLFMHRNRRINFFVALSATEGFTRNRRAWDFSTQRRDDRQRFDLLFGAKVGWIFGIFKKMPKEYYYN